MLEPEENGWWLVRFPDIPEALTEGESEQKAHANAADCLLAALEGYVKAGRPIPRPSSTSGNGHRVTLPSLATAKLAVYETMRSRNWSMTRLAEMTGSRSLRKSSILWSKTRILWSTSY